MADVVVPGNIMNAGEGKFPTGTYMSLKFFPGPTHRRENSAAEEMVFASMLIVQLYEPGPEISTLSVRHPH
jgi:hypothetical protein